MNEAEDTIEISIKDISRLIAILESLSYAAWVAAQSLKMIVEAGEGIEKMMFSPPKKREPSKETLMSLDAWLGEEDI